MAAVKDCDAINTLKSELKKGECRVKFKKVENGRARVIKCTTKHDGLKQTNRNVITVWCDREGSFKSFRKNSVIEANAVDGTPITGFDLQT